MGEICKNYIGVACINRSCPIANKKEYIERGMDVTEKCEDCTYYKGCEDCAYPELYRRHKISRKSRKFFPNLT